MRTWFGALASLLILAMISTAVLDAQTIPDTTAPTFVSMSVSPTTVAAGGTVTVDVRITDAESGVATEISYPYVYYRNAGGSPGGSIFNMTRVSGTPQDGVYRGTLTVPASAATGRWRLDSMGAKDVAGNLSSIFPPASPTASGEFDVMGTTPDTTPPSFVSMSVSPTTVAAGGTVTVDVRITDAESGVATETSYPYVYYRNAGGSPGGSIFNMARVSGTPQDGVYRGTLTVPASAATGRWRLDSMGAKDVAGNLHSIFPPESPTASGEFDVAAATSDTTPPSFVSMSVSPTTVAPGGAVTVDVRITDAESGVATEISYPYVYYRNAGGSPGGSIFNMTRVSGTPQDGVYRGTLTVPASAATGRWRLDSMGAKDVAGNLHSIFPPQPPTANGEFDVVSQGGTPTCSARQNIRVTTNKNANGQLRSTVVAPTSPPGSTNTLQEMHFGQIRNASVHVEGVGTVQSGQRLPLSAGTTTVVFTVSELTADQGVFVPFTALDGCGAWPSFVGAGAGAL